MATLALLKIKVFSNKDYDAIIVSMTSRAKYYPVTQITL